MLYENYKTTSLILGCRYRKVVEILLDARPMTNLTNKKKNANDLTTNIHSERREKNEKMETDLIAFYTTYNIPWDGTVNVEALKREPYTVWSMAMAHFSGTKLLSK